MSIYDFGNGLSEALIGIQKLSDLAIATISNTPDLEEFFSFLSKRMFMTAQRVTQTSMIESWTNTGSKCQTHINCIDSFLRLPMYTEKSYGEFYLWFYNISKSCRCMELLKVNTLALSRLRMWNKLRISQSQSRTSMYSVLFSMFRRWLHWDLILAYQLHHQN